MILINQKNKLSALTFAATLINFSTLFSGTGNLEINVDGTNIGTFSGHLTAGTVNKTDAGSLILSHPSNDIDVLEINGGEVVINTPSNINPTSIVVKFNASGIDPITSAVNTAKLRITDDMNTGLLDFTTDGEIEIDSSKIVTWNVVPTGAGLVAKSGSGVLEVASDLSAATTLAGIHVDAGTLYIQSGKTPNAAIQVASGAKLQLDGVSGGADSEVSGAVTVQTGGSIEVDENVKVGNILSQILTYTFDTADGYYKSGSEILPWPSNFKIFYNDPTGSTPEWSYWSTDDTSDQVVFYGGVRLDFLNSGWIGSYAYRKLDSALSASHPTTTVITDNDVALSGSVSMESGSKINLKTGSTWAHAVTVTSAS